jgi:peptide/nickel transport system ATP-binding protein
VTAVAEGEIAGSEVMLSVEDLVVRYTSRDHSGVRAVDRVSFEVLRGETVGLVGESGCGKSSAAKAILQLIPVAGGSVRLDGVELTQLKPSAMRPLRGRLQMIFQDPISSLNPRRRVRDIVAEGLVITGGRLSEHDRQRVDQMLSDVGLDPETVGDRRPRQLSGGQCQRVSIARALMMDPALLVCDEPVAALDVSIQAQVLNLLRDIVARSNVSLLFISHDLGVVRYVCDRVVVMYLGRLCEVSDVDSLFSVPRHPYTRLLLDSIPDPVVDRARSLSSSRRQEEMPSLHNPPSGCRFRTRCAFAQERCAAEEPSMRAVGPGSYVACHFAEEIAAASGPT